MVHNPSVITSALDGLDRCTDGRDDADRRALHDWLSGGSALHLAFDILWRDLVNTHQTVGADFVHRDVRTAQADVWQRTTAGASHRPVILSASAQRASR